MEASIAVSLSALAVSIVGAGVSIPLAIRADRRASAQHRAGEVVWELEADPHRATTLLLRNIGRATAYDVSVQPNFNVAVESLPFGVIVRPGDAAHIRIARAADLEWMSDSIRVTWQRTFLAGGVRRAVRPSEAAVPTLKVRADIAARASGAGEESTQ